MDILINLIKAFLVGGTFCLIGQILIDYTKLTPARILVSFVVAGTILGFLGWYQPIIDFAGAGASVPISGFGNSLAKGVKEGIDQYGLMGVFTGGLIATSGGIASAILFGYIFALIFKPGQK